MILILQKIVFTSPVLLNSYCTGRFLYLVCATCENFACSVASTKGSIFASKEVNDLACEFIVVPIRLFNNE